MGDQNLNGKLYRPLQGFTEMIVVTHGSSRGL